MFSLQLTCAPQIICETAIDQLETAIRTPTELECDQLVSVYVVVAVDRLLVAEVVLVSWLDEGDLAVGD